MKIKNIISSGILLLLVGCSSNNGFKIAHQFYMNENYAAAIDQYDRFIRKSENGAEITRAELERSDCYLQLGFQAKAKKNTLLSSRLLYLANSNIADSYLDNVYYELSEVTLAENNIPKTLDYYEQILVNFADSELIPEVLYNKIELHILENDNAKALEEYRFFFTNYSDNNFRIKAESLVNPILPDFIEEVDEQFENQDYETALKNYLNLHILPTSYKTEISNKISDTYWITANRLLDSDLVQAREQFYKVVEFSPFRQTEVENRFRQICSELISNGADLINNNQLDEAESMYNFCFIFIEDYQAARVGLLEIDELRNRNASALEYLKKAEGAEKAKKISEALSYYRKANQYVKTEQTSNKIFLLSNRLKADKDSKGFALEIIKNYKNGKLVKKLENLEESLIEEFGSEAVRSTSWKVLYSSGEYKQEVRYDILGPVSTHYYIWQVDLLKQKISPLNKESEKLMD